jgi:hypothetical protein
VGGLRLTVVVGSSHVGKEVLDLLADDHISNVVDGVTDDIVASTNG